MNKYFKNEKSNSRSAAPRKTYDINPALFTDNRPENVVQNKLKETISSRKSVPFIDNREHVSISQASTGVAQLTKTETVDDFINSDGTQNTLGTLDMAANIGGVVDSAAGLINYGGHVDDLEGITNFKGWKDNFALDGRAEGTDFETANNSWGNDYTGTLGATAGVLGAGATMWNGVRNIGQSAGNIKKAYSAGDTKGGLEQGASIAENLVAIGGSGLGAVNSVNAAVGNFNEGAWNAGIGAAGGSAIPIMGAISGGMGMMKNAYQISESKKRAGKLGALVGDEEVGDIAALAQETAVKRGKRAGINLASNTLSTAGSIANATGVGVGVGSSLAAGGAAIKYGAAATRGLKQKIRNNSAEKSHIHKNKETGEVINENETYAAWKARQKAKIADPKTSFLDREKYKMSIRTTANWDKSTEKKDAKYEEKAKKLYKMRDSDNGKAILLNLGFNESELPEITSDKIIEQFKKRE